MITLAQIRDGLSRAVTALFSKETRSLVLLGFAALALLGFAELADEVAEGETHMFDRAVLEALRGDGPGDPIGPHWLVDMARDVTSLGGIGLLAFFTLTAIGWLMLTRRPLAGLYVAASVGVGAGLSAGLKAFFDRERPDEIFQIAPAFSASFPSGHATLSAVVYLTIGALLARVLKRRREKAFVMGIAVIIVILVGVSRIYLGVHWATDVLAGWALGAAWAALAWTGARAYQARVADRTPPPSR